MLLDRYFDRVDELFRDVRTTQRKNIELAGELLAQTVKNGGCVHVHDTGHIINSELINRGGGLVLLKPFNYRLHVENPVRPRDRSELDTSMEGLAAYALKASGAKPGDLMIIGSVSGRNVPVIDLAVEAKKFGLKIIAVTSMEYSSRVESDHPSGKRLFELADIVLDNCAPAAEAMLDVEGLEARLGAASGLSATYLLWSVTVVAVENLLAAGFTPSVLKSANYPGGSAYNAELYKIYAETGL